MSIASLPLGQENEMTGVSSSDLFSMVKLRTVIVPKRSYTKCAEQILLILKFQDPVMEYR